MFYSRVAATAVSPQRKLGVHLATPKVAANAVKAGFEFAAAAFAAFVSNNPATIGLRRRLRAVTAFAAAFDLVDFSVDLVEHRFLVKPLSFIQISDIFLNLAIQPHSRILSIKSFDKIAVPALGFVGIPAVAFEQAVGESLIEGVAEERVGLFEFGDRVERGECGSKRCVRGGRGRDDIFDGQKVWAATRLIVVEQATVGLAAGVVGGADWHDFGPSEQLGPRAQMNRDELAGAGFDDAVVALADRFLATFPIGDCLPKRITHRLLHQTISF